MAEYLPNIGNETVQEAQRVPSMDEQRDTSRHVANKMKIKRGEAVILKAAREKQLITYNRTPIKL